MSSKQTTSRNRIAIVDENKCRPKKCNQECKKNCPVVKMGKMCIDVDPSSKIAYISESLCIGCGICTKKCPFGAIKIINLPENLEKEVIHRFGNNGFKLHRLPTVRNNQVLGLIGSNGIGKSTCLKILANKIQPNLGNEYSITSDEIIRHFRGKELQNYFTDLYEGGIKCIFKPQYVDLIPQKMNGIVREIINKSNSLEISKRDWLLKYLDLNHLLDRKIDQLSGGELQRFAIACVLLKKGDMYIFDEPSSFLDIRQRMSMAHLLSNFSELLDIEESSRKTLVVEHDLAVLDYLSDYVCLLYGQSGAYGVVTSPFSTRNGINIYLDGYIPTENMRFREDSLNFNETFTLEGDCKSEQYHTYSSRKITLGQEDKNQFELEIEEGYFNSSQIILILGQNGTGKTTFIRALQGLLKNHETLIPNLSISAKPQSIYPKFEGTVRDLLSKKIGNLLHDPSFHSEVVKPLEIDELLDNKVQHLSGGELQRVAIIITLGKSADIYLLDEPSSYLDVGQRLAVSKVIKRFIYNHKRTAFIVEHDFMMATYLADQVMVFKGEPGKQATAKSPVGMEEGINDFLMDMEITYRRDPTNGRPRINKFGSEKDREQKKNQLYFG